MAFLDLSPPRIEPSEVLNVARFLMKRTVSLKHMWQCKSFPANQSAISATRGTNAWLETTKFTQTRAAKIKQASGQQTLRY